MSITEYVFNTKVVYEVKVTSKADEKRVYFGNSGTMSKERYHKHAWDFNHELYSKCTELSNYI